MISPNQAATVITTNVGGSHNNKMLGGSTITPESFTFAANDAGNGGTVMGPFINNEATPQITNYVIIITGTVDTNDSTVIFKPESNSIVLFEKDEKPYASITTDGVWGRSAADGNTFKKQFEDVATPKITKYLDVKSNAMMGGRRTPRKNNKASRRRRRRYGKI